MVSHPPSYISSPASPSCIGMVPLFQTMNQYRYIIDWSLSFILLSILGKYLVLSILGIFCVFSPNAQWPLSDITLLYIVSSCPHVPLIHPLLQSLTADHFISSIVLPFPECHRVEIIEQVAFSNWLPSISNMQLIWLVFPWLNTSWFLKYKYYVIFPCVDIPWRFWFVESCAKCLGVHSKPHLKLLPLIWCPEVCIAIVMH